MYSKMQNNNFAVTRLTAQCGLTGFSDNTHR